MPKKLDACSNATTPPFEEEGEEVHKKKKKKKKQDIAEPSPEEVEAAVVDEDGSKKRKNKGRQASQTICEQAGEDAVNKKKRKVKQAPEAMDEQAEEGIVPGKKKNKEQKEKKATDGARRTDLESSTGEAKDTEHAESLTLFVGGLPWSVDEDTLRNDFAECGELADCHLVLDKQTGKSRGLAFVTFKTEAGVQAALAYHGTDYWGRRLDVRRAETRGRGNGEEQGKHGKGKGKGKVGDGNPEFEVFIKGLPLDATEDALRKIFADCGEVVTLNMPTRDSGLVKGFAWITFSSDEGLKSAVAKHGHALGNSTLTIEKSGGHVIDHGGKAKTKGKGKAKGKGKGSDLEIFVSNLSYETTETDLRKDFLECGAIERMHMPVKGSKFTCMGFAWITFKDNHGAEAALAFDGDQYGGRRLKVEKSGQHGGRKLKQEYVAVEQEAV